MSNDDDDLPPPKLWESLNLDARLVKVVKKLKFEHPTSLQFAMTPRTLQNKNLLLRAQKNNGKTYGYLVGILQKLLTEHKTPKKSHKHKDHHLKAIIFNPTKELAEKTYSQLCHLKEPFGFINSTLVTGLESELEEVTLEDLGVAEADILVSTGSSLESLMEMEEGLIGGVENVVLEEVDLFVRFGQENILRMIKNAIPEEAHMILSTSSLTEDLTLVKDILKPGSLVSLIIKETSLITSSEDHLSETNLMALIKSISSENLKFFTNQRLKTYESWTFDHVPDAVCTSEKLAEAGFYSTATESVPSSSKCALCGLELVFDKEDDPGKEHEKHAKELGCPFLKIDKPENEWTLQDILKIYIEIQEKNLKKRRLEFEFEPNPNEAQEVTPSKSKQRKVSFSPSISTPNTSMHL